MNESIKYLKSIACGRMAARRMGALTKKEKIRLSSELMLIEKTHTEQYFINTISMADEERKNGDFCVLGSLNCSFLLYCAGVTTIDPLAINSPFERLLDPLCVEPNALPPLEICRDKFRFAADTDDVSLDFGIYLKAKEASMIDERLFVISLRYPPPVRYQFTDEVLEDSCGAIVWQEQVMELLRRMGGFGHAQANALRRDGCKGYWRDAAWYARVRRAFLPHAVACGYDYEFADRYLRYIFEANMFTRLKAHVAARVLFR